jgi:hypothetical protein
MYQFREYHATTRREAKLQGSWCQTPFIGTANGERAREPTCHDIGGGGDTMMVRRDQFGDDPGQQTLLIEITTTPGSNLVAPGRSNGVISPLVRGILDFLAAATERITCMVEVIYCSRPTSLQIMT